MSLWSRITDPCLYFDIEEWLHNGVWQQINHVASELTCAPDSDSYKFLDKVSEAIVTPFLAAGHVACVGEQYAQDIGEAVYGWFENGEDDTYSTIGPQPKLRYRGKVH